MRSLAAFLAIALLSTVQSVVAADEPSESKPQQPDFVVYAAEEHASLRSAFFRILLADKDKSVRIEKANTIEEALASQVGTLVMIMPGRELPPLGKETLQMLKLRKIIGIGSGTAKLFGKLGLQISWDEGVIGAPEGSDLTVVQSNLLGTPPQIHQFQVLKRGFDTTPDVIRTDVLSLFMPTNGNNSPLVDVIARWSDNANYAPIVRQGNFVLVGVPDPATDYSAEYRDLIRQVCIAMREHKSEAFKPVVREETTSGTYEFNLAPGNSTDKPFNKLFYFRFTESKQLTAKLEHSGSDNVMMLFMGEDDDHLHWERKNAKREEPLEITVGITSEELEKIGERYWNLNVTNFGNKEAKFKLTIAVDATE